MRNRIIKYVLPVVAVAALLQSCGTAGGNDPGVEYAPDMYVSKGYEPMSQVADKFFHLDSTVSKRTMVPLTKDGKAMREPVKGTIPTDLNYEAGRSYINNYLAMQYPYTNSIAGKDSAMKTLKNPVPLNEVTLANGKKLYNRNCSPCHGADGLGKGPVSVKFPPNNIPSYKSARIQGLPDGGIYHSITYGLNLMGSYASVLTPQERWEVIHYVNYLKNN
jgi:mono/diheme cytochrome c family protein